MAQKYVFRKIGETAGHSHSNVQGLYDFSGKIWQARSRIAINGYSLLPVNKRYIVMQSIMLMIIWCVFMKYAGCLDLLQLNLPTNDIRSICSYL